MTSTLLMPPQRSTTDAQFTFRAETPMKAELEAIAATLDRKTSDLLREVVAAAMPELRKQAAEEVNRREKLPQGVTQDALETALAALIRKITLDQPIHLELQDLLAPESKAVWVFLSYLWGEGPSEEERKALAALAGTARPRPGRK